MAQKYLAAVAGGADPVRARRQKRIERRATIQGAVNMERIEQLRQFNIFSGLDDAELGAVLLLTEARECASGEQLIEEGGPAEQLYLLVEGRAAVKVRESGGGHAQIDELGSGDVLGWGAVVEPHVYTASAWATEPVKLLLVDGKGLRELCDGSKQVGYAVFKAIGEVMSARLGHAVRGRGIDEFHRFKILRDLDFAQLDAIGRISRLETFSKGDLLISEGSPADELYLFLRGKADVRVRDPQGRQVLIDEIWPGDVLGWSAAMEPHVYTASAWAAEPSEAIVVNGPMLRELCACDKQLGYQITKGIGEVISRRFGRAVGVRGDLRAKDVRAFDGQERVVWDNGELQLTTQAVLIGMKTDSPEVIPLEAIEGVDVVEGQVVFRMHSGDVWSPPLEQADQLAALARDAMLRTRYAQRRKDYYLG
jgi:CRP-like cAMP-binding protein